MTPPRLLSVLVLSWAAYSGLFSMPLWVGGLTDELGLSSAVPGYMGSTQLVCAALASLWTSLHVGGLNLRRTAACGAGLILLANATSAVLHTPDYLFVARAGSGVGEGVLLASLNAAIARAPDSRRQFAWSQTAIALFGIGLFAAAPAAMSTRGVAALFLMVATVGAAGAFAAFWLPQAPAVPDQPGPSGQGLDHAALAALGVIFIGCQGAWAYLERLGAHKDFTTSQIGRFLVAGQLLALLGPIAASRSASCGARRAIILGLAISAGATLLASQTGPRLLYPAGAALFQFGTLFIVTSYLAHLAQLDASGRNAAAAPALISLGSSLGPAAMAAAVGLAGHASIGWIVVAAYAVAAGILLRSQPQSMGSR